MSVPSNENMLVKILANQNVIIDMLANIMHEKNSEKANATYDDAQAFARKEELRLLKLFLGEDKEDND